MRKQLYLFFILFSFALAYGAEDYSFESYKVTHNKKNPYTYVQHLLQSKERWINNDAHREKISTSLFGLLAEAGTKRISNEVESFKRTDVGEYYSNPEKDVLRVLYLIGQKYDEKTNLLELIETSSKKHFARNDVKTRSSEKATKNHINKHWSIVLLALEFGRKNLFDVMDDHFDFSLFGIPSSDNEPKPSSLDLKYWGYNDENFTKYLSVQQKLWNYIPTITSPSMKEAFEDIYKEFRRPHRAIGIYEEETNKLSNIADTKIPEYSDKAKALVLELPNLSRGRVERNYEKFELPDNDFRKMVIQDIKDNLNETFKDVYNKTFESLDHDSPDRDIDIATKIVCDELSKITSEINTNFFDNRQISDKALKAAKILDALFLLKEGNIWKRLRDPKEYPDNYYTSIQNEIDQYKNYEKKIIEAEKILNKDKVKYKEFLDYLKEPNSGNISEAVKKIWSSKDLTLFEAFDHIYENSLGSMYMYSGIPSGSLWEDKYAHLKEVNKNEREFKEKIPEILDVLENDLQYESQKIEIKKDHSKFIRDTFKKIHAQDIVILDTLNAMYEKTVLGKEEIDLAVKNNLGYNKTWDEYYKAKKSDEEYNKAFNEFSQILDDGKYTKFKKDIKSNLYNTVKDKYKDIEKDANIIKALNILYKTKNGKISIDAAMQMNGKSWKTLSQAYVLEDVQAQLKDLLNGKDKNNENLWRLAKSLDKLSSEDMLQLLQETTISKWEDKKTLASRLDVYEKGLELLDYLPNKKENHEAKFKDAVKLLSAQIKRLDSWDILAVKALNDWKTDYGKYKDNKFPENSYEETFLRARTFLNLFHTAGNDFMDMKRAIELITKFLFPDKYFSNVNKLKDKYTQKFKNLLKELYKEEPEIGKWIIDQYLTVVPHEDGENFYSLLVGENKNFDAALTTLEDKYKAFFEKHK